MNGCELAIGITALASAIAAQIEDDGDLAVLAAAMTQFGDTLATIAAWRARCAAEAAAREAADKGGKSEDAGTSAEDMHTASEN